MDEQREDDRDYSINNIKFVADPEEAFLFDGSKLVYTKGIFGDKFNIVPAAGNKGC